MTFQGWLDNLDYSISFWIRNPNDPLRRLVEGLPTVEQWQVVELIGQSLARQFPLICHPDRPEADYTLDFSGEGWLDYVPSPRPRLELLRDQSAETSEGASAAVTAVKRYGHRVELDPLEADLLTRVDGKRSIIEIIEDDGFDEDNALQRVVVAREFFRRMAGWDHLMFEIP
jgi:hypothetical protein